MKIRPLLLLLACFTFKVFAQSFIEPNKIKSFSITVNYPNYTIKTEVLKNTLKVKPKINLTYYWYSNQKIIETTGGFDGKLLHGYYKTFLLNDQLLEFIKLKPDNFFQK